MPPRPRTAPPTKATRTTTRFRSRPRRPARGRPPRHAARCRTRRASGSRPVAGGCRPGAAAAGVPAARGRGRSAARAGRARPGEPVATLGETRLAVGTFVERGLDLALDPLPLGRPAGRAPAGRRPAAAAAGRRARSSTRPAGPAWPWVRWPRCWPGRCCADSASRRRPPRSGWRCSGPRCPPSPCTPASRPALPPRSG